MNLLFEKLKNFWFSKWRTWNTKSPHTELIHEKKIYIYFPLTMKWTSWMSNAFVAPNIITFWEIFRHICNNIQFSVVHNLYLLKMIKFSVRFLCARETNIRMIWTCTTNSCRCMEIIRVKLLTKVKLLFLKCHTKSSTSVLWFVIWNQLNREKKIYNWWCFTEKQGKIISLQVYRSIFFSFCFTCC